MHWLAAARARPAPLVPKSPSSVEAGAAPTAIGSDPTSFSFRARADQRVRRPLPVASSGPRTIAVSFNVTLVRAAPLGILIQRIVSDRRVPVGRVPFGLKDTGRLRIRWNLLVNGHQLHRGRYSITLRMFDRHHNLIALARPAVITIRP
jgi:hypothetical protein